MSLSNKSKKRIIAFLLLISVMLTSGTFAYWANFVEGTSADATGTLAVGSGQSVSTVFEITNEMNSGGLLVPTGHLANSGFGSVDNIDIIHSIKWSEDNEFTQLEGTDTYGLIGVQYSVLIYQNDKLVSLEENENIYELVIVDFDEENPTQLILGGESVDFIYHISIEEPMNQEEYNHISEAQVEIQFQYIIASEDITTGDLEDTILDIVETEEYYFTVSSSANEKIIDYNNDGGLEVIIPQYINDVEIKTIGANSFLRNGINAVVIQEGITLIDTNAFHSNNLTSVTIPSTVEVISYNAFYGNNITSITFNEGLKEIRSGAFSDNSITKLVLPSTLEEVGFGAFGYGQSFITEITIGDDVEIANSTSFGWYGGTFRTFYYDNNKQAGTYLYIDGEWTVE